MKRESRLAWGAGWVLLTAWPPVPHPGAGTALTLHGASGNRGKMGTAPGDPKAWGGKESGPPDGPLLPGAPCPGSWRGDVEKAPAERDHPCPLGGHTGRGGAHRRLQTIPGPQPWSGQAVAPQSLPRRPLSAVLNPASLPEPGIRAEVPTQAVLAQPKGAGGL